MKTSRRSICTFIGIAAILFFISGCGRKNKQVVVASPAPTPAPKAATSSAKRAAKATPLPVGYMEEGVASWYGIPYHGRRAADGETYDMETLVAAHRVMPFNTWLRVTNLANNKGVTVRIIDRGPFVDGRIIDLSKAAAREIDLLGPGIGKVRLEVIAAPADIPADDFYAVQVGVFSVVANAERLTADYQKRYGAAKLVEMPGTAPRWRVLVGKESSMEAAQHLATTLSSEVRDVFVVRLDEKLPAPAPIPPRGMVWQTPENVTFDPHDGSKPQQPSSPPPF